MCDLDGSDIGAFDASDGLDFSSDFGSSEGLDHGSDIGSSEGFDFGSDIESFEPIESAPLEDVADIPFEPADDSADLPFDEASETFEETPLADTEELPFEDNIDDQNFEPAEAVIPEETLSDVTDDIGEQPVDTTDSDNVNYSPVDDIMNSDMSNAEKKDALQNLKEELQNNEPSDGTDWERTSLTPEQEEQVQDMIDNGELDVPEVDPNKEDPEHSALHLPADSGKFLGERGNSSFIPDNNEALNLMNDYGRDSVEYKDNYPDFSPFTKHETPWGPVDCQVEIPHMTDQRNNGTWEFGRRPDGTSHDPNYDIGNFAQADNALLEKFRDINPDASMDDVLKFIKDNNLTRHDCEV